MKTVKVLIEVSGGGFFFETKCLIDKLYKKRLELFCVTTPGIKVPHVEEEKHIRIEPMFYLELAEFPFKKLLKFLKRFLISFSVVKSVRPDLYIWVGSASGLPIAIWCRLFGAKVIYIESVTRVFNFSLTGKIVQTFKIANRIYVQWPEMVKKGRQIIYKGWVL